MAEQAPSRWEQVLAELASETELLAEGLRRGQLLAPVRPWQSPAMPPLPAELVVRAQQLLSDQLELRAKLAEQLRQAPAPVRPHAVSAAVPAPLLLDLRA